MRGEVNEMEYGRNTCGLGGFVLVLRHAFRGVLVGQKNRLCGFSGGRARAVAGVEPAIFAGKPGQFYCAKTLPHQPHT